MWKTWIHWWWMVHYTSLAQCIRYQTWCRTSSRDSCHWHPWARAKSWTLLSEECASPDKQLDENNASPVYFHIMSSERTCIKQVFSIWYTTCLSKKEYNAFSGFAGAWWPCYVAKQCQSGVLSQTSEGIEKAFRDIDQTNHVFLGCSQSVDLKKSTMNLYGLWGPGASQLYYKQW